MRGLIFLPVLALLLCSCTSTDVVRRPRRPKFYQNVISLSPGVTEVIVADGNVQFLKGRTAADDWPATVTTIPVVASVKPDYELIKQAKPDLVIYDASLYNDQDIQKIKALGADTFAIDANTVDGYIKQLYDMGSLLASETRFNEYVDKILRAEEAAQGVPLDPKPKVAVLMPGAGGSDYIAGTKSFVADAVREAGGDPVGPDADHMVIASPESLVSLNPDVIVVPGTRKDMSGGLAVAHNPKYQTITAIKNGRIRAIDPDVLLRRGARVDVLIESIHDAISARGNR